MKKHDKHETLRETTPKVSRRYVQALGSFVNYEVYISPKIDISTHKL